MECSGPEETHQSRSAREPTRQPHANATDQAHVTSPIDAPERAVIDLMEYALRHNLMDDALFEVLYKRATKELVRHDHIGRFNTLTKRYYDSHPSDRDSKLSKNEPEPARASIRTTPALRNQAQR